MARMRIPAALAFAALLFTLLPAGTLAQASGAPAGFAVPAKAAYLLDFHSGQELYALNPDAPIPPASLTKIMTLYLAAAAIRSGKTTPDTPVAISRRAWAQNPELRDSSLMYLEPGQKVTVREVLLGIAVPSGNDAAVAMAEHLAGSVEAFVAQMNEQARALGLKVTTFVDPHGLSPKNITTAREIAQLAAAYIRTFPENLKNLHSVPEFAYPKPENLSPEQKARGQQPILQYNRNRLLASFPGTDGLKTGFVDEAGYNLVVTATRGEMRLIGVLLGTRSEAEREAQGIALLTHGFNSWSSVQALRGGEALGQVRVWKGAANAVSLVPAGPLWVAVPRGEEGKLVKAVQAGPAQPVVAPVRQGQELGSVAIVLGGRELARAPLVAAEEVRPGSFLKRLWDSLRLFLTGLLARGR